jgi:phosphonoacetaldehyde hydrolase
MTPNGGCRAHCVIDSIADVIPCLDDIEARIARGERP